MKSINGLLESSVKYLAKRIFLPFCFLFSVAAHAITFNLPATDTDGTYTISWSGATTYALLKEQVNGSWITVHGASGPGLITKEITGKAPGTYQYKLENYCHSGGPSAPSLCGSLSKSITVQVPVPAIPSGISISPSGAAIALTWSTVSGATSYELQRNSSTIYTGTATSRTDAGIVGGTSYTYRVRACNGTGCSGWRTGSSITAPVAPETPASITPTISGTSLSISWGASSGTTRYELQRSTTSVYQGTARTYSDATAVVDTAYTYRVRACNAVGCSGWRTSASVSLPPPAVNYVPTPIEPVLATAPSPSSTIDKAQATPAQFNVNSAGQATYAIPIVTAAGSGGMAPTVSVSYNSGAGNGPLGLGWSLNAGGSVSRCRQTEGEDKNAAPISWGVSDRFCLNGQRLMVDSGYVYGAPSSRYKTAINSFSRITAIGGSSGQPDYFKVEHKDGRIDFYGLEVSGQGKSKHKLDSNKVLSWLLSESQDSAGNKIRYNYLIDSEQYSLQPTISSIDYAFDSNGSNPAAQVIFNWQSRSDVIHSYIGGLLSYSSDRLRQIVSKNSLQVIREYNFTYDQILVSTEQDELSRLDSIRECVGNVCLNPTSFDWILPNIDGFLESSGSFSLDDYYGGYTAFQTHEFADINGDGLLDIAWMYRGASEVYYAMATLNSSGDIVYTEQSFENNGTVDLNYFLIDGPKISFTDYNGDGRADLVLYQQPTPTSVRIFLSKPQSDGSWKLSATPVQSFTQTWGGVLIADLNADGLEDIMNYQTKKIRYLRPNGIGYGPEKTVNIVTPQSLISSHCPGGPIRTLRHETGDFNGDGRLDFIALVCTSGDATQARYEQHIYTSHGLPNGEIELRFYSKLSDSYTLKPLIRGPCDQFEPGTVVTDQAAGPLRIMDLNNDGLSDVIGGDFDCAINHFRLNTGTGFLPKSTLPSISYHGDSGLHFADLNQDGYPDLIGSTYSGSEFKVRHWSIRLNRFSTSERIVDVQYPMAYQDSISFRDVNGDGSVDYFVSAKNYHSSQPTQIVQLNKSKYVASNKVDSVTNGLGHVTTLTYEPIHKSNHYGSLKGVDQYNEENEVCDDTDVGDICWSRQQMVANSTEFYSQINNPFADISSDSQRLGSAPLYSIFSAIRSLYVVSKSQQSAPAANESQPNDAPTNGWETYSYYYDKARMQAAGFGFLGFEKFTKINRQTGARIVTHYRQDWPFIGNQLKTEAYDKDNNLLNKTEYSSGFVECYSGLIQIQGCTNSMLALIQAQGTKALFSIEPFTAKTRTTQYYLNTDGGGALASIVEVEKSLDQKGNTTFERVSTGLGGSPLHVAETTDGYSYPSYTYSTSMGRLDSKTVVTSQYGSMGGSSITRESTFGYYISGSAVGLLQYEIIEPNDQEFEVRTDHYYNAKGLRVLSETTSDTQTRRGTELEYDALGRYVDKTYEYFPNPANPNLSTRRLVSQVINRDRYGTPTELRQFIGSAKSITHNTATTLFGTVYFSASSMGDFYSVDLGVGAGPNGVCPSYTSVWKKTIQGGGGEARICVDIAGRKIREAMLGFDGDQWIAIDYKYNRSGQLLHISEPHFLSESALWTSNLGIDLMGRPTSVLGPVREQDGVRPETAYIYQDERVEMTNAQSQTRIEEKNVLGQVARVQDPILGLTQFEYDARGNMTGMSDPNGNTTIIMYDLRDRKRRIDDPDKGEWFFEYNRFNEVTCQIDAKNQTVAYEYDVRGRPIKQTSRSTNSTCTSGAVKNVVTWRYDREDSAGAFGKISSIRSEHDDLVYVKGYSYDAFGREKNVSIYPNANADSADVHRRITTWDQFGRVFQTLDQEELNDEVYDRGGVQNFYSPTGYLSEIRDASIISGQQKLYHKINSLDARRKVVSATLGNQTHFSASYYKDSGLAKRLSTTSSIGAISLQRLDLSWDLVGNLQSRHELGGGTWIEQYLRSRDIKEDFQYDNLNRLYGWSTSGDFVASETVTYDSIDNITNKSGVGNYSYGSQCTHASGAGPHAVCKAGAINLTYDKNGNLTSDGTGRALEYTVLDQLSLVTKGSHTTRFSYAPSGDRYMRIDKVGSAITRTTYLGDAEKIVYPNGTMEWKRNIAGVALLTITSNSIGVEQSRKINYLHHDHLGSTSMVTDANGYVVKDFYYDPWGASRAPNANITNWIAVLPFIKATNPLTSRGFTGHEHLDEVGLVHMNGRIYDPKFARFVQADPIIQDPLMVQSLNRYSYVWNNPLNATDPSGFLTLRAHQQNSDEANWSAGRTPDMDLDGRSTEEFDGYTESEALRNLLSQSLKDAAEFKRNSISNTSGGVTIEDVPAATPQTTQTSNGNNSVAAVDANPFAGFSGAGTLLACDDECREIAGVPPSAFAAKAKEIADGASKKGKVIDAVLTPDATDVGAMIVGGPAGVVANKGRKINRALDVVVRYDGPKPTYHVNPAHVPGQRGFNSKKTPLPSDAENVFKSAVPNDPQDPTAWFGRNSDGQIYRYSLSNDGTAHFSGIDGVGDGVRNFTEYAQDRLNGL